MMTHTWAICAYKDSPYLEACMRSLVSQSAPSKIILCTSTPSEYIDTLAQKYNIPVYIRDGESGISEDWNFAYELADTDLVTIAHQDDMYQHDYLKTVLLTKEKYPDMSMFTSASITLKGDDMIEWGSVEIVKKILRIPLRIALLNHKSFIKKASVIFGNPIICPSCTYDKNMCKNDIFVSNYKFVLDWDILLRLAVSRGRWVCIEKPLIMYRVHDAAATKMCIKDHVREEEEQAIFKKLWPWPIAYLISKMYRKSYDAYK